MTAAKYKAFFMWPSKEASKLIKRHTRANNNTNLIYKAPVCWQTSVALVDSSNRAHSFGANVWKLLIIDLKTTNKPLSTL